jgi:hypothetical protein
LELQITSQVVTDLFIQYIVADQVGVSLKVDLVKDVPDPFGEMGVKDGVRLDNLQNIDSNKVLAIFGRTDPKDFIDLYWILQDTDWSLMICPPRTRKRPGTFRALPGLRTAKF